MPIFLAPSSNKRLVAATALMAWMRMQSSPVDNLGTIVKMVKDLEKALAD